MATETLSKLISALKTDNSSGGSGKENAIGREPGTGSLYDCLFYAAASSGSTAYLEYSFDLSGIPDNAVIDAVSCAAGGCSAYPDYYSQYTAQLYSGSTAKGSAGNLNVNQGSLVVTFDGGTWTRAELNDCRIRFYAVKRGYGTMKQLYITGARIAVTYTYQSEKFMLKLGGSWTDVARVFKKVSGIWVEQTDLANVIEDGVRYKNGGEIVKPITVDITASGHYSYAYAEINGVKYYSNGGSTEVNAGDVITFCVYNGGALKIDGETVLTAASGATSTYDWTVPSGITKIEIAPLYYTVISPTYYGSVTVTTTGGGG